MKVSQLLSLIEVVSRYVQDVITGSDASSFCLKSVLVSDLKFFHCANLKGVQSRENRVGRKQKQMSPHAS